ncbi:hypothetical protein CIK99_04620 [Prevotella sp. P5-92]|nr:hypothetical protein CIK99_04620 [Prevotella sp. P5-92]
MEEKESGKNWKSCITLTDRYLQLYMEEGELARRISSDKCLRSNLPFVIRDCLRLNYLQKRLLTNSSGLFTVVLFNMAVN